MNEDYVSFEVAKLLKEKGFMLACNSIYLEDGKRYFYRFGLDFNMDKSRYSAPTLYMVQKWLREEKGFEVVVVPTKPKERTYRFDVWNYDGLEHFIKPLAESNGSDVSYEEALEAGIIEALKLI